MKQLSTSDYFTLNSKINKKNRRIASYSKDPRLIRIGLLGSSTLAGIKETLNVKCDEAGLAMKAYEGPYNQYHQELLNGNSGIYEFAPHLTFLLIDTKDILGEDYYFPYRSTAAKRKALIKDKVKLLSSLAAAYIKRSKGKLIINNFSVPSYSTLGILENRQAFGFFEMIRSLNSALEKAFANNPRVYIFDYDNFTAMCGKTACRDDKMYYLADMRLSQRFIPLLCDEYMRYIRALLMKTKKCIVLDLDNTLWGGIVGEDGFDGIGLGPTPPGNAFMEFQKYLLSLFEKGIILAVNSNNNYDEAMKVIKEHPYMVLRENCFASMRINWENKPANIIGIAKELNIGLESILYVDDDKRNRQLVSEALPQVSVMDMPDDPALYVKALAGRNDLDSLHITEEDANRGAMYADERKRREAGRLFGDISDYLSHLEIKVDIDKANSFSLPRISQLSLRTNQFNMTSRRYQEEDIRSLARERATKVYSVSVRDKFGDSGISGAFILKEIGGDIVFDNILLSCRILGREIEKSVASFCLDMARGKKAKNLVCEYIPTPRNQPAKKFLKDCGFKLHRTGSGSEFWRLDVRNDFKSPSFIKVNSK